MSITIADLKYQDTDSSVIRHARDNYDWLDGFSVIEGVSGKATVSGISVNGNLLKVSDCSLDDIDTDLLSKEVELDYYNISFPIQDCDLRQTWLSAFANKYVNESEVYIWNLIPFLTEKLSKEINNTVITSILTEAIADADVTKVAEPAINSPMNAYNGVLSFIDGFSDDFLNRSLDYNSRSYYSISVSAECYKNLASHLSDKTGYINIGGYSIRASRALSDGQMFCTYTRNLALAIDDTEDLRRIVITEKPWLSTNYIGLGVAFKGTYIDSKEIVITS